MKGAGDLLLTRQFVQNENRIMRNSIFLKSLLAVIALLLFAGCKGGDTQPETDSSANSSPMPSSAVESKKPEIENDDQDEVAVSENGEPGLSRSQEVLQMSSKKMVERFSDRLTDKEMRVLLKQSSNDGSNRISDNVSITAGTYSDKDGYEVIVFVFLQNRLSSPSPWILVYWRPKKDLDYSLIADLTGTDFLDLIEESRGIETVSDGRKVFRFAGNVIRLP